MANYVSDVVRVPDRDVFAFFVEVAQLLSLENISVTVVGSSSGSLIAIADKDALSTLPIAKSAAYNIDTIQISRPGYTLNLTRNASSGATVGLDKLTIHNDAPNRQGKDNFLANEIVDAINVLVDRTFRQNTKAGGPLLKDSKVLERALESHHQVLSSLQSTTAAVTEQIVDARKNLEEEYAARRTTLEDEFQKRQTLADQTAEEFRQSVLKREQQLKDREDKLDNRDHIHARRQLREQITTDITTRLKGAIVPMRTSSLGWIVFCLALGGAGFLGWLSYTSLVTFSDLVLNVRDVGGSLPPDAIGDTQSGTFGSSATMSGAGVSGGSDLAPQSAKRSVFEMASTLASVESGAFWYFLIRGSVTGLGAVLFLLYAIGWLKSIYHADVKAQRELERYAVDLNRASWAVETIMEAKAGGGEIPNLLVAGISRNLFEGGADKSYGSSNDPFAELLRASTKTKIGPGGAEFELSRRGGSKIADKFEEE